MLNPLLDISLHSQLANNIHMSTLEISLIQSLSILTDTISVQVLIIST